VWDIHPFRGYHARPAEPCPPKKLLHSDGWTPTQTQVVIQFWFVVVSIIKEEAIAVIIDYYTNQVDTHERRAR